MVYVMHVTAAQPIAVSTTLADKDALLRAMAAGTHLTTLAFSEKGLARHFWAPVSRLAADGASFTTSAAKSWVTSAARADSYVSSRAGAEGGLPARVGPLPRAQGREGRADLRARGRASACAATTRRRWRSRASAWPQGDLLTELGQGRSRACSQVVLPWFAIGTAAMAHGLCRAAVAATGKHLAEAGFEHTGGKLRDFPGLRARLAEMSVRDRAARAPSSAARSRPWARPPPETPLLVLQARLAALAGGAWTSPTSP